MVAWHSPNKLTLYRYTHTSIYFGILGTKSVQVGIQQETTKTPRGQTNDLHSQKPIEKAMSAMKLEFLDCFLFLFLSSLTKSLNTSVQQKTVVDNLFPDTQLEADSKGHALMVAL